ncbi:MAG: hypothetical protein GC182_03555 [Rhodopseudomonas sp.]|nr:hypothetical protein [Rhodopseudomonas sp.]
MKTAMLRAAFCAGAWVMLSLPIAAQAQTTVIPGHDDSTVIINRDGKAPVVLDVNRDIKGVGEKPKANAEAQTKAQSKAQDAHTKDAQAKDKSQTETTGQASGSIKADCVTKTGKESRSVNSTKSKCD